MSKKETSLTPTADTDILASLGISPIVQDQAFVDKMAVSRFLPNLRLQTKYHEDKPEVNKFYFTENKKHKCLGNKVDVIVLDWLPKAVNTESGLSVYDASHPLFEEIEAGAGVKMAGTNPNMFGAEFIVFIPELDSCATFFFGTATLRNEIGSAKALIGKTGTFTPKLIPSKKYDDYWSADITDAVTPAALTAENRENLLKGHEKFKKLPEQALARIKAHNGGGDADTDTPEDR